MAHLNGKLYLGTSPGGFIEFDPATRKSVVICSSRRQEVRTPLDGPPNYRVDYIHSLPNQPRVWFSVKSTDRSRQGMWVYDQPSGNLRNTRTAPARPKRRVPRPEEAPVPENRNARRPGQRPEKIAPIKRPHRLYATEGWMRDVHALRTLDYEGDVIAASGQGDILLFRRKTDDDLGDEIVARRAELERHGGGKPPQTPRPKMRDPKARHAMAHWEKHDPRARQLRIRRLALIAAGVAVALAAIVAALIRRARQRKKQKAE